MPDGFPVNPVAPAVISNPGSGGVGTITPSGAGPNIIVPGNPGGPGTSQVLVGVDASSVGSGVFIGNPALASGLTDGNTGGATVGISISASLRIQVSSAVTQVNNHLTSATPAPTVAAGANAGTGPPAPILAANSTDQRGTITFGTGTTPAAGAMVVVTFQTAFGSAPFVVLTWSNVAGAGLGQLYVSPVAVGSFTINCTTAPAASQPNTTYSVNYLLLG